MKKGLLLTLALGMGILGACSSQETGKGVDEEKPKVEQVDKKEQEKQKIDKQKQAQIKKEGEYITNLTQIMLHSYETIVASSQKYEEIAKNPALMFNDDWKNSYKDAFTAMEEDYNKLQNMEVPDKFKTVHEKVLHAFDCYLQSRDKFLEGMNTGDPSLIKEALQLNQEGNRAINEMRTEIDEIRNNN